MREEWINLPEVTGQPMRKKALLAILFAGSVFSSPLPAICDDTVASPASAIQQISNQSEIASEIRAYYLLLLAQEYLAGGDRTAVEARYISELNQQRSRWLMARPERFEFMLTSWANQVSRAVHVSAAESAKHDVNPQSVVHKNSILSDQAISAALKLLEPSTDRFAKLNMYFIASCLYQKSGNADGMRNCEKVLTEAFRSCERPSSFNENQIKAASSVLNAMAYGIIPIHIEARPLPSKQPYIFAEQDFQESERLKLRAIAMVDRLALTDDLRRRAHRDLVLWYEKLGKEDAAKNQMQVLFELVGCKDESILYPQAGACGHLVWWRKTEKLILSDVCGMG